MLPYQNAQSQSLLLDRLPAELKNEIYTHIFVVAESSITRVTPSKLSPHPLSLLLACRRIYHEAAVLAFNTYTFSIRMGMQPTYLGLKSATSHLSSAQVDAIRSLSILSSVDVGSLLSNALFVFPCLDRFLIETKIGMKQGCRHSSPERHRSTNPTHSSMDCSEETDLSLQAIDRYAPQWFVCTVQSVVDGKAYAWQAGSKWMAQWPQLNSVQCYSRIQCDRDGLREELYMDDDAIGTVPGVQPCVCGRKDVSWTHAVLVQEGGRHVDVEVIYCVDLQPEFERTYLYKPDVVLVPGTAATSEVVIEEAGIKYEADEEYWEAIRRRNGNFGAVCRGLWRKGWIAYGSSDCQVRKSP